MNHSDNLLFVQSGRIKFCDKKKVKTEAHFAYAYEARQKAYRWREVF